MALSSKEKLNRRKNKVGKSIIESTQTQSLNEASDGKMRTLDEIEDYINGKRAQYLRSRRKDYITESIEVSMMFLPTKTKQLPRSDRNLVRISFSQYGSIDVDAASGDLVDFLELPGKREEGDFDFKSSYEIVKLCDSEYIYNLYKKDAYNIIKSKMIAAYSMFTGTNMIHRVNKRIPTLRVGYDQRMHKFVYEYNPDFILVSALDDWFRSPSGTYNSFRRCYLYNLSFMITHEMMHIIHHNTKTSVDQDNSLNDHRILNQIYDSFINCTLQRVFSGIDGVGGQNFSGANIAPVPGGGVEASIKIRFEHNMGFKKFNSTEEMVRTLYNNLKGVVDMSDMVDESRNNGDVYINNYSRIDLSEYSGLDVMANIFINPFNANVRKNSNIFNSVINCISKTLSEGKCFDQTSKLSDAEKESDKDEFKPGTLVSVKGVKGIYIVSSYNEEEKKYDVHETECVEVSKVNLGGGMIQNTPTYADSGKSIGQFRRMNLLPRSEEDLIWFENDSNYKPPEEEDNDDNKVDKELEDKLSDMINSFKEEDDSDDKQDDHDGKDDIEVPSEQQKQPEQSKINILNVGDIVWCKRLSKFGKIISSENGLFELVEVEEVGSNTIDRIEKEI